MALFIKSALAFVAAAFVWNVVIGVSTICLPRILRDGDFGPHYEPNSLHIQGTEGYGRNRHDEYGYNNPQGLIRSQREPDASPIVVLGDSFTEAMQIPRRQNFCSLFQDELREIAPDLSVMNLGISGRSMCDAIVYGRTILDRFHPRHVFIQCQSGDWLNDATNSGKDLFIEQDQDQFAIVRNESGNQQLKLKKDRLVSLAPLFSWSYLRLRSYSPNGKQWLPGNLRVKQSPSVRSPGPHTSGPSSITKKLLDWQLKQLLEVYPVHLITVLYIDALPIPIKAQTSDSPSEVYLFNRCRELGVSVIRTKASFYDAYQTQRVVPAGFKNSIPGQGHLNAKGHQLVGKLLASYWLTKEDH